MVHVLHATLVTVINVKPPTSVKHALLITLSSQTSTSAYCVKFLTVILAPSKIFAQVAQLPMLSHQAQLVFHVPFQIALSVPHLVLVQCV